jgi:UPF0755 protein
MKNIASLPGWAKIAGGTGAAALVAGLGFNTWWSGEIAAPAPEDSPAVQVDIPNGSSAQSIGKQLAEKKIIKSELAWKLWTSVFSRQSSGAKAGSYQLSPGKPLPEVASKIWSGKVTEVSFEVTPGSKITKMAAKFQSEAFKQKTGFSIKAEDFIAATKEIPRDKFPWLPKDIKNLEGFLYAETYSTPKEGVTAKAMVHQMLKQFETYALPLYKADAGKSGFTLLEWVTLSSIVEKEAVVAKERPLIAGVFINRLKQKIKLGSDPTAEYAFNIGQTADKPLTFKQVGQPHPYNTYAIVGLPPGPIASPGLSSLKAVLNPDGTDMLFFVAKHDGTHIFTRTNAEHNKAVQEVARSRQQQKKN